MRPALTFDALDARIPKNATVTTAQRYCRNLLTSRTVPYSDKVTIVEYIRRNPKRFSPRQCNGSDIDRMITAKINGPNPQVGFVKWAGSYLKNQC